MAYMKFIKIGREVRCNDSVKDHVTVTIELNSRDDTDSEYRKAKAFLNQHLPRLG